MEEWLKKLNDLFEDLFLKKLPSLPKNAKEVIVKVLPWLILVFAVISIPGILAGLGFGAIAAPFWIFGGGRNLVWMLGFLLTLIQLGLGVIALPALFNSKKKGWQLLYWSSLLNLLGSILLISLPGVLGAGIGLYLLYQIRSSYK